MIRRQPSTIGVDRKFAVEAQPSARHECSAFAALAKAEILQRGEHGDRERVVDHRHVDVLVRDASTSSTVIGSRYLAAGFMDACRRVVTAISASCSEVVP